MLSRTLVLVLVAAVAPGCGAEASPPVRADAPGLTLTAETQTGEAYCYVAFAPDEPLRAAAELAAARWSVATGCDIVAADGGVPIVAWPRLFVEYTDDGRALLSAINHGGTMRPICGLSTWTEDESAVRIIDVSLACDEEDALTHEMGHALARLRRHSRTGVMAAGENAARSPTIDAASLELVCHELPCAKQSPEG